VDKEAVKTILFLATYIFIPKFSSVLSTTYCAYLRTITTIYSGVKGFFASVFRLVYS